MRCLIFEKLQTCHVLISLKTFYSIPRDREKKIIVTHVDPKLNPRVCCRLHFDNVASTFLVYLHMLNVKCSYIRIFGNVMNEVNIKNNHKSLWNDCNILGGGAPLWIAWSACLSGISAVFGNGGRRIFQNFTVDSAEVLNKSRTVP